MKLPTVTLESPRGGKISVHDADVCAAKLRELVEAASTAAEFPEWAFTQTGKARLAAALKPFLPEQKEEPIAK